MKYCYEGNHCYGNMLKGLEGKVVRKKDCCSGKKDRGKSWGSSNGVCQVCSKKKGKYHFFSNTRGIHATFAIQFWKKTIIKKINYNFNGSVINEYFKSFYSMQGVKATKTKLVTESEINR